jgi:hypothetical protein
MTWREMRISSIELLASRSWTASRPAAKNVGAVEVVEVAASFGEQRQRVADEAVLGPRALDDRERVRADPATVAAPEAVVTRLVGEDEHHRRRERGDREAAGPLFCAGQPDAGTAWPVTPAHRAAFAQTAARAGS